ncbi:MAG: hypothetical protein WAN65_29600 [Candidatus Sulfotelmatobacter sp.]
MSETKSGASVTVNLGPAHLLRKSRTTFRFPGAAQHVAQRSGALLTRDRNRRRVQSDPGCGAPLRAAPHQGNSAQTGDHALYFFEQA